MDPNAKCEHCQFWMTLQPGGAQNRTGECRRFPPQLIASVYTDGPNERRGRGHTETYSSTETVWPETKSADWCGEFLETAN